MKDKKELEVLILRVGNKYLNSPIRVKIFVGKVVAGDINIKKGDKHN